MTLKNRNRIFLISVTIFSVIVLINLIFFIFSAINGKITFYDKSISNKVFQFLFSEVNGAGIISSMILCIFSIITGFLITQSFEKTHAPEILYFSEFLLGIFFNTFKIYVLLFSLDKNFSSVSLFIQKCALAGQIMCILSFLLASLFSDEDQIQNTDKNILIILAASIIISSVTPVNLHSTQLSGLAYIAFRKTFIVIIILLMLITSLSFALSWHTRDEKKYMKSSLAFIIIISGGFCIIYSINYFFIIIGSLMLSIGTKVYISMLHRYYLWK
jgi:hypothetical protein